MSKCHVRFSPITALLYELKHVCVLGNPAIVFVVNIVCSNCLAKHLHCTNTGHVITENLEDNI